MGEVASTGGVARTFQNLALFENLSVLDNLLVGRHHLVRTHFWQHLIFSPAAVRSEEHRVAQERRSIDECMPRPLAEGASSSSAAAPGRPIAEHGDTTRSSGGRAALGRAGARV